MDIKRYRQSGWTDGTHKPPQFNVTEYDLGNVRIKKVFWDQTERKIISPTYEIWIGQSVANMSEKEFIELIRIKHET